MLRDLEAGEIELLLRSEVCAHLGCVLPDARPYVVPISYAYDGRAFYSYSADGTKLTAMRRHPLVCVQVDRIEDAANWSSVVAWGRFEQLADQEAADALQLIVARLRTVALVDRARVEAGQPYVDRTARYGVVYRIGIEERSGRTSASDADSV
ncbi:MAG TPA: pyridoxamine 5'-phosphate oxidase family protein [Candidatus Limnocylindria bacterium]|jgi:nitroimidazol reductase NimA-like FMN-containing flavoprotein (pyridoxamine 5'-phosphate oxidase superfamily)|nr:pyridoxamine 5'-phosphate oxidase family protein [Candidatus Limnocylindria bacterium]